MVFWDRYNREGAQLHVGNVDGKYTVDHQQGGLVWQLPTIDSSNPSGSMEFNCEGEDADVFFPVTVQFECERLICDVDVSSASFVLFGRGNARKIKVKAKSKINILSCLTFFH